ncbi:hypothetical protein C8Q75DRAFT_757759 [Abortiporus biennis]|nr:hypothetical protein C8Q75DRAFT_757759 [Abortiporus biennis]
MSDFESFHFSASQRATPIIPIHFDNTLGALFIGLLVATFLTGLGSHQTYVYFLNTGKKDRISLRTYIGFLWVVDILLLALASNAIYNYLITNYANPFALPIINWAVTAYLATASVFDFLVRCLFIYRIWKISERIYLGIVLMVINCVVIAVGLWTSARFHQIGNFFELDRVKTIAICAFATIACLDTLIAIILSFLLWMKKGHASQRTSSQIDILMRYIIHTGALTSLCAIAVLVTYLTMSDNFIFQGIYLPLPKVYHNALLASLNARKVLRSLNPTTSGSEEPYTSIQLSDMSSTTSTRAASNVDNKVSTSISHLPWLIGLNFQT